MESVGSMIVPSDSRQLATVTTVPLRTCATPVESGDPIDLDRKRSMCGRWSYTPGEPSRAHGKLSPSRGFGLQRTQLTSTPASRTSAFADGSVDPAERIVLPRSTSVRAHCSVFAPPPYEAIARTPFSPFRKPSFEVTTRLILSRGKRESPNPTA